MIEIYGVQGALLLWEKLDYTSIQKLIDFKLAYNKEVNTDTKTNSTSSKEVSNKVSEEDIANAIKEAGSVLTMPDGTMFDFSAAIKANDLK